MSLRRLRSSKDAQMPFAIVALFLLVMSTLSLALIADTECLQREERFSQLELDTIQEASEDAVMEFEGNVYGIAMEALLSEPFGQRYQGLFTSSMQEHINDTYPTEEGHLHIWVVNCTLDLHVTTLALADAYPGDALEWDIASIPASYRISGSFEMQVQCDTGKVILPRRMDRALQVPYPLLMDRMVRLEDASGGEMCELENIVRYELTALAQKRALQGYGAGSERGSRGTEALLTEDDVAMALEIAILLEQLSVMRCCDQELLASTGLDPAELEGDLDPADIFLSLVEGEAIDLSLLMAQTIYGAVDQLVVRYLEYLHVLDVVSGVEYAADTVDVTLQGLLDDLMGTDHRIVEWIGDRMERAGYTDYQYRFFHYYEVDSTVTLPERWFGFHNQTGEYFGVLLSGPRDVDFPRLDLHSCPEWEDFYKAYKTETFELAQRLSDLLKSIALALSDEDLGGFEPLHDPGDGASMVEEITAAFYRAIVEQEGWLDRAVEGVNTGLVMAKDIDEAFLEFLEDESADIFDREGAISSALEVMASDLVGEIAPGIEGMDDTSIEVMKRALMSDLVEVFKIRGQLEAAFDVDMDRTMVMFEDAFIGLRELPHSKVADMVAGAVEDIPGMEETLRILTLRMLEDLEHGSRIRSDDQIISMPGKWAFTLTGDGRTEMAKLSVNSSLQKSIEVAPATLMSGGLHSTSLREGGLCPYTALIGVSVNASMDLCMRRVGTGFSSIPPLEGEMAIGFDIEVPVLTSWALRGVSYVSTDTLSKDVQALLGEAWQAICSCVASTADGLGDLFISFKGIVSDLLAQSMDAVMLISGILQAIVSEAQEQVTGAAFGTVAKMGEWISDTMGEMRFECDIMGVKVLFETNVVDLALSMTKDVLKVTLDLGTGDASLILSARVLRFGQGDYGVLFNATLADDDWTLTLVLDPFMRLFNHFIEISGVVGENAFELHLPEVIQYERVRMSLSQVPGVGALLSNIPLPVPGMKGSVDAGFEVQYRKPFVDHVVINEVEQNPSGSDGGEEWIELYNPTSKAVDLSGWAIMTTHGEQALDHLDGIAIQPHEVLVYGFEEQTLDNGWGSKFPQAECVVLIDTDGKRIDSTPWVKDLANDGRSWQRTFDGSDRWEFKDATEGISNGKGGASSSQISWAKDVIFRSITEAFGECGGLEGNLESLSTLIQATIDKLMERVIDLISSCIVEFRLFVSLGVRDLSSSLHGGLEVSLVVTSELIEDALRWIWDSVRDLLFNIQGPSRVAERPAEFLSEDIFVRCSVFGSASLPSALVPGAEEYEMQGMVEVNLAAIGHLMGKHWGDWSIGFGTVLCSLPGGMLPRTFGVDADCTVDVWLIRAYLHPA